jgi:hypothetical protein
MSYTEKQKAIPPGVDLDDLCGRMFDLIGVGDGVLLPWERSALAKVNGNLARRRSGLPPIDAPVEGFRQWFRESRILTPEGSA